MEFEVVKEFNNVLIGRREIGFVIKHPSSSTPSKYQVREAMAGKYGVNLDVTFIIKMMTMTGAHSTSGICHIYHDPGKARTLTPTHVQLKNQPPQERTKAKEKK